MPFSRARAAVLMCGVSVGIGEILVFCIGVNGKGCRRRVHVFWSESYTQC